MSATTRPLGALAGVGFLVLGLLGTLLYPSSPDFVADPAEIAEFYVENDSDILTANVIYLVAVPLFLVFAGYLRSVFGAAEGGSRQLATMAFGGAVAGATLMLGGAALDTVGALRVDENGAIDPATAAVYLDASGVLWGLAAPMALAVLVFAAGLLAFRHDALPKWLGAISLVLGVALLIPPVNFFSMIVFVFWPLVVGLVLYLRPPAAGASP